MNDLVGPLMELAHKSPTLASQIWLAVFPACWGCLAMEEQRALAEPIANLLQQDYHAKQAAWRPNPIQTLFKSLLRCEPAPELAPILVKHLGAVYNCWGEATLHLEKAVVTSQESTPASYKPLSELYHLLGEADLLYGLWKTRFTTPEILAGVGYEQCGEWKRAQDEYYHQMVTRHATSL